MFSLPSRTLLLSNPSISSSESPVRLLLCFTCPSHLLSHRLPFLRPSISYRRCGIACADDQMVSSPTVSTSRSLLLCTNSRTSTFRPRRRLTISSEVISMVITISIWTTLCISSLLVDMSLGIKVLICLLSLLLVSLLPLPPCHHTFPPCTAPPYPTPAYRHCN